MHFNAAAPEFQEQLTTQKYCACDGLTNAYLASSTNRWILRNNLYLIGVAGHNIDMVNCLQTIQTQRHRLPTASFIEASHRRRRV